MTLLRSHGRLALFVVLVALQAAVVVGAVAREEHFRRTGTDIVLEAVPVDPRDLLRGDFVILAYAVQDLSKVADRDFISAEDDVYVVLEQHGRYWERIAYRDSNPGRAGRPDGTVVLRGVDANSGLRSSGFRVTYQNIDRYYVPEGKGILPSPPDVIVVSGDGSARIKRLEIEGKPWP